MVAGVKKMDAVDAVDLLDASFHNLSAVDETTAVTHSERDEKNTSANSALDGSGRDEDFEAFVSSKRLKEKDELQESLQSIKSDAVTTDQKVKQEQNLAELKDDLQKGLEPTLVVTDTSRATPTETQQVTHDPKRFISPKDFELMKVIGMGSFGKVLQVRVKTSDKILAMKVMSKRLLNRKSGYVENINAERNILTRVRHPFIVMMHASFQTKYKLFIVMDFLAGGELFLRLGREGIFLEKTAAFYLAEIILALEFLHNLGVLHRDLKPENVLLGEDGHVCITDFGLAKDFSTDGGFNNNDEENRASTICGTQEYMAPEMVAQKGYGRAADYWSLGCIAYEMLNGLPPFRSKLGAKDLFRKIMSEKVKMPDGATAAACKLLKGLLNRTPHARLGAAKSTMFEVGGPAGLKKMEFFKSIEWDKLERKEVEPPEVLTVTNEEDLKHFHDEFTQMPLPRSVVMESRESFVPRHIDSEHFRGFSFIQDGFLLPERNQEEIEKYWNSADEDGESESECASSKVGSDDGAQQLIEPEKKKRPPRKKKKKNKVADTAATATNGAKNGTAAAASSGANNGTDEKPDVTENASSQQPTSPATNNAAEKPAAITPSQSVKPTLPQKSQATTTPPAPMQAKANVTTLPSANPAAPQQKPYSLDKSRNQKYAPPQRRGLAPTQGTSGPQPQHYQKQPAAAPPQQSGWKVAHHHQIPPTQAAAPRGWATQSTPTHATQHHNAQPQIKPATPAASLGPAPGSWAAKISAQKGGARPQPPANVMRQPPPPASPMSSRQTITVPPSPSSDWRSHNMSPSPMSKVKSEGTWPGLGDFPAPPTMGNNDFPAPPNMGKPKTAIKPVKPLKGAWATRK